MMVDLVNVRKFGERIKELREERGLSRLALSKALNIGGGATICRWERGEQDIGSHYLIKLADFFNVSIDYLVGRSDEPFRV